jgi:hypothetical protein
VEGWSLDKRAVGWTGGKLSSQEANVTRVLPTRLQRGAAIVNTAVEYGSDRLELRRGDGDLASPCGRQTCIQQV